MEDWKDGGLEIAEAAGPQRPAVERIFRSSEAEKLRSLELFDSGSWKTARAGLLPLPEFHPSNLRAFQPSSRRSSIFPLPGTTPPA